MAKELDPEVACPSDDSEQELNNSKEAYHAVGSPLENRELVFHWPGFTCNCLGVRRGGAQADHPVKNKSGSRSQKTGTCISCGVNKVPLWHGNRYRCHKGDKAIVEHAAFCESCATGYDEDDDPIQCPIHSTNPWPQSMAETIPLQPVFSD